MSVESALAKVPKPSGVMRSLSRFVIRYRVVSQATSPEARGTLAAASVLEQAATLGLRFVGTYAADVRDGWMPREGWVSEDGAVRLSARRAQASGAEGMMSLYYLSTTFTDGAVILTWAKSPPPLPSTPRAQSIGGTGDLAADYATHRAALDRRGLDAAPPIAAATVEDCVALTVYYDRFMTKDEMISSLVAPRLLVWAVMATAVVLVVALVLRML